MAVDLCGVRGTWQVEVRFEVGGEVRVWVRFEVRVEVGVEVRVEVRVEVKVEVRVEVRIEVRVKRLSPAGERLTEPFGRPRRTKLPTVQPPAPENKYRGSRYPPAPAAVQPRD